MIAQYQNAYTEMSKQLFSNNPFTWVYGLSRTTLAICSLITLTFSETTVLFDEAIYNNRLKEEIFNQYNLFYLFGWEYLRYAKALAILLLLLVASGWRPRFTGVFQWWVTASFYYSSSILEGGDQIAMILTLLLIPVTLLDNRKWHWQTCDRFSEYKKFVGNLMFVSVALQMSLLYLNAAMDKIYTSDEWKVGSAFYYYVNDAFFSYPDWMDPLMINLLNNSFFVSAVTWGTILLELMLFGILFSSTKNKRLLFPFAVMFHFAIVLFLGLFSFFFAMLGGLILYLVPKETPVPRFKFQKPSFISWIKISEFLPIPFLKKNSL